MQKINFVSSVCGAGKTFAAMQHIKKNRYNTKFLITVPTIELSNQIVNDLMNMGIQNVLAINYETADKIVKEAAKIAIRNVNEMTYGVIILTNATFTYLPDYIRSGFEDWVHILDEIPKAFDVFTINLPYEHKLLTDLIEIDEDANIFEGANFVVAKNVHQIKKILKRNSDYATNYIKPLLKAIISDNHSVLVNTQQWQKIVKNNDISPDKGYGGNLAKFGNRENNIEFISCLKPNIEDYFQESIYMGANLEKTALYQNWKENYNVKFSVSDEITSNLRLTEHTNGELLTIYYGQTKKFSRHQANLVDKETDLNGAQIHLELAKEILDTTKPILSLGNLDDSQYVPNDFIQLSSVPQGINKFQHINQFCFNAAYNFSSSIYKMLEKINISHEATFFDMNINPAYQALTRTSLRNPESTEPVVCYVNSKAIADEIAKMFIGCTLISTNGDKEKVVGKSALGDKVTRLLRLKESLATEMQRQKSEFPDIETEEDFFNKWHDIKIVYNQYTDMYANGETKVTDITDFIKLVEKHHKYNISDGKEDNILLNTNKYFGNSRKKAECQYATSIILDFDNGMTNDEFNKIFHDKFKMSYISYSTSTHLIDGKPKFRVILFVNMQMDEAIYTEVYATIVKILFDHGYASPPVGSKARKIFLNKLDAKMKLSGLDRSKENLSSIFYMPTRNLQNDNNRFFFKSYTHSHEIPKHCFDVKNLVKIKVDKIDEIIAQDDSPTILIKKKLPKEILDINILKKTSNEFFNNLKKDSFIIHKQKIINRINNEMVKGNRSHLACSIAGTIAHWENIDDKLEILDLMAAKGCSNAALKSAKNYANLNNHYTVLLS